MGLLSSLAESIFGRSKYELPDDDDEEVIAHPTRSEPPQEVGTEDIEKVVPQAPQAPQAAQAARAPQAPPAPPAASRVPEPPGPVDLKSGLHNTHFSSTILIGLEERLRQDAYDLRGLNGSFLSYLRRTITSNGIRLPTMPEAVLKLDRLLRNPDCSVNQVADAVRAEPAIATKLVGIANSPFYSGLQRIPSVEGAIGRLGMRETKNIVQAVAFGSKLLRVAGWEKEIESLYHHSIVSALAARALAKGSLVEPDEAFIAGLIHDIGRSVLLSTLGEFEHAQAGKKGRVDAVFVRQVSASIHSDLSALVAESWNAMPDVVLGVRFHHTPEFVSAEGGRRVANLLRASDLLARFLLEPVLHDQGIAAVMPPELWSAVGQGDKLTEVVSEIRLNAQAFSLPLCEAAAAAPKKAV